MMQFTYEITPRPVEIGSGWRLHLFEDGVEVGGGIFPPLGTELDTPADALQEAYEEAEKHAYAWLDSREA